MLPLAAMWLTISESWPYSVISRPGALSAAEYEALGVARISYGPLTQRVALRAFRDLAIDLYGDGVIPTDTPALN